MKVYSVGHWLLAAGILIVSMFSILTAFSIWEAKRIAESLSLFIQVNSVKQRNAINLHNKVHDLSISLRYMALVSDNQALNQNASELDRLAGSYPDSELELDAIFKTNPDSASVGEELILQDIKAIEALALPIISEVVDRAYSSQKREVYLRLDDKVAGLLERWLKAISRLIEHEEDLNTQELANIDSIVTQLVVIMVASLLLLATVVTAILWYMYRAATDVVRKRFAMRRRVQKEI